MADFPAMNKYLGHTAARYDEVRAPKAGTLRDQVTVENYLAKLVPGDSVLDIPAGTGRFIDFCISHELIYTGVDVSQDMLEVARTKIPAGVTNVELKVADARALPFANDAFDYAIVVKFIKWLPTLDILIERAEGDRTRYTKGDISADQCSTKIATFACNSSRQAIRPASFRRCVCKSLRKFQCHSRYTRLLGARAGSMRFPLRGCISARSYLVIVPVRKIRVATQADRGSTSTCSPRTPESHSSA